MALIQRYGQAEGDANGADGSSAPETSAPPRVWTPGLMIAALALLAAWWLRRN